VAPDPIRCERVIATAVGGSTRCSRFTLKNADGSRDQFCLAHSRSEHGEALRSKAAKAQEEAALAERQRRKALLNAIAPYEWTIRENFNYSRYALFAALVRGELSVLEVRELRALIADAERNAQTHECEWPERSLNPARD